MRPVSLVAPQAPRLKIGEQISFPLTVRTRRHTTVSSSSKPDMEILCLRLRETAGPDLQDLESVAPAL